MALVNRVEAKCSVNRMLFGVDLWPVLRNSFMMSVTHTKEDRKSLRLKSVIKALMCSFISLLNVRGARELLLSSDKFSEEFDGQIVYRDACALKQGGHVSDSLSLGVLTQSDHIDVTDKESVSSIYFIILVSSVIARLCVHVFVGGRIKSYVDQCAEGLEAELEKKRFTPNVLVNRKVLVKNLFVVVVSSFLIKTLLKGLRPQRCYVVCYYSLFGMAFCSACNQLSIPVSDIQHGISGKYMRAYGKWESIPSGGYNTLPSEFMCWTGYDKSAIDKWAVRCPGAHAAKVTGNLWKNFLDRERHVGGQPIDVSLPWGDSRCVEKTILITLNSVELNNYLRELLLAVPSNYFFVLRVHPDYKNANMSVIEKEFKQYNENLYVDMATGKIQALLHCTDVHITEWSASVYDAHFEGVPSIVITEVGRDYFEDFIATGEVRYCPTPSEALTVISEI